MLQATARKIGPSHVDDGSLRKPKESKQKRKRAFTSPKVSSPFVGVVYSLTGKNVFWEELSVSVASVTEKENTSITVFTLPGDMSRCKDLALRVGTTCTDAIKAIEKMSPKTRLVGVTKQAIIDYWHKPAKLRYFDSRVLKISSMLLSPYNFSLFLDSDTYMCEPLSKLAARLGDMANFDMLGAFNHAGNLRQYYSKFQVYFKKNNSIPEAFKEINTGVLFAHTDRVQVQEFAAEWMLEYMEMAKQYGKDSNNYYPKRRDGDVADQPCFLKVLWQSEVKRSIQFYGLPPQWNMKNWRTALKYIENSTVGSEDWPSASFFDIPSSDSESRDRDGSCCPHSTGDEMPVLIDHACESSARAK